MKWESHTSGRLIILHALRQLERAQSLAPEDYPLISLLRAHALLAMKQFPEAMTALQAYLQKDPQGPNSDQARKMLEQAQAYVASKKNRLQDSIATSATHVRVALF